MGGLTRQRGARLLVGLALFLFTLGLARGMPHLGWLAPLELAVSDLWHQWAGPRGQPRHAALVVVDEASLQTWKDDPLVFWTPQMAQASQVLRQAGATVVGLDLLFSLSPARWLEQAGAVDAAHRHDRAFRQEIAAGHLVLVAAGAAAADGRPGILLPASEYVLALPGLDLPRYVGLADLESDADGVVRHFRTWHAGPGRESGGPLMRFAALLAHRAGAPLPDLGPAPDISPRVLPYWGPPGHFPRVSLATLLAPDALQRPEVQALKGRVVIIGGEYVGMNDTHDTPYRSGFFSPGLGVMTGPEIHANIVESLLAGRQISPLGPALETAVQGGFLLLALGLFQLARLRWALGVLPVLLALPLLGAYGLFLRDIPFPAVATDVALLALFLGVLGLRYVREGRARARVTELFGRYVSAPVVDQLVASGGMPSLGGVQREITVLFSDIRSFTVISEKLAPEEVVEMLNRYFSRVCDAVQAEGGTVDKFIGDAVMVLFGAPLAYDDHADRALRSALRIRDIAREFDDWFQQRFAGRGLPPFAVGVGLHTGPVVVGNMGSARRMEYTAIGDTVNVASRIEGMTRSLDAVILASAATLSASTLPLRLGQAETVALKGKSVPLSLVRVEGLDGLEAVSAPSGAINQANTLESS